MNRDSLNSKDKLYCKIWRHCNNPLGDNKQKFGLNSGYTQFVNCLPEFSTMRPRRINNSCGRCDTPHRHSIHPVLGSPATAHIWNFISDLISNEIFQDLILLFFTLSFFLLLILILKEIII